MAARNSHIYVCTRNGVPGLILNAGPYKGWVPLSELGAEGSDGLTFTSTLDGYSVGSNAPLDTSDTLIGSLGKLQGQLDGKLSLGGGTLSGGLVGTSATFSGTVTAGSFTANGTAGAGYIGAVAQSSAPATPTSGFRLYANSSHALSWKGQNGFTRTFDGTTNTADRTYVLPNASGTVALTSDLGSYIPLAGTTALSGSIVPNIDNFFNLASPSFRFASIYGVNYSGTTGTFQSTAVGSGFLILRKLDSGTANQSGQTFTFSNAHATGISRNDGVIAGSIRWQFSQPTSGVLQDGAQINAVADGTQSGTNTPTKITFQTTSTSGLIERMVLSKDGYLGLGIASPSHVFSIGRGYSENGFAAYNDGAGLDNGATNWERVRQYWNSGVYTIQTEAGGVGVARPISIFASGRRFTVGGVTSFYNFDIGTSGNGIGIGVLGPLVASTAVNQSPFVIAPSINQTSTAGWRTLWISPYIVSSSGSTQLLIDAGTNSAANGAGTHTSRFSVANTGAMTTIGGTLFSTGNWFLGTSPVDAGYKLDVNGTARITGNTDISGILGVGTIISTGNVLVNAAVGGTLQLRNSTGGTALQVFNNSSALRVQIQQGGTYTDIPSARLAVNSTTEGILLPRMTTTQKNAIVSPAEGLEVYDLTLHKKCVYTGSVWETITSI